VVEVLYVLKQMQQRSAESTGLETVQQLTILVNFMSRELRTARAYSIRKDPLGVNRIV
jgi:hypothetical protein